MSRLYSYCIPGDDGAAPNPFWQVCTLNICKPVIRRTAQCGDWIVGTGSKQFGYDNKVVYAMEVTETMTMQEYETFCKRNLPEKIPNWKSKVYEEKVGDCIYDFSTNPPTLLDSVHDLGNMKTDLGGVRTLLSDHFYYFGDQPEPLPDYLLPIVKQGQGHKSSSIDQYLQPFIDWISSKDKAKNNVFSKPKSYHSVQYLDECKSICAKRNQRDDEDDELLGDE